MSIVTAVNVSSKTKSQFCLVMMLLYSIICYKTSLVLAPTQLVQTTVACPSCFDNCCMCSVLAKKKAFQPQNTSSASLQIHESVSPQSAEYIRTADIHCHRNSTLGLIEYPRTLGLTFAMRRNLPVTEINFNSRWDRLTCHQQGLYPYLME